MTESIRIAKEMDINDDENDDNLRLLTPTFIMCLRDFYLELVDDDDTVYEDANEFFEARLEVTNEVGKESIDEIQKCILNYFPKRRCFAISQPAMNKKLLKLETMTDDELADDFKEDIKILKEFVYGCEAKVLDAVTKKSADGVVFEAFLRTYVNALNLGKTMTFTQAYERASALHNGKMVVTVVHEYRQEVDAITLPVEKKQDLQEKCMMLQKTKMRELRKKLFPFKMDSFDDEATKKMEKIRIEKMDRNKDEAQHVLATILASLHDDVVNKKILKKEYNNKLGLTWYRQDMEDIELKFHKKAKNFDLDERQTAFLAYKKNTKDVKLKVALGAKKREEEEQNEKLRLEMTAALKVGLGEKLREEEERNEKLRLEMTAALKDELGAKLREEEERNEKLRLEMEAALKKQLDKHLNDIKQEKESVMKLELERMKQNYTGTMGIETIRRKEREERKAKVKAVTNFMSSSSGGSCRKRRNAKEPDEMEEEEN